ncbi:unnamed protein product [Parnassius apollo]|uniref:(apollo) hypothetical protein n=1 Tax=Parnassius apollo TaxID=110799 RepID=A0A8S3XU31_PARAO|nr:unnamed protein product [Parnassius apollo]
MRGRPRATVTHAQCVLQLLRRCAAPTLHAQSYVCIPHYVLAGTRGARQGAPRAAALHPHPIPRPTVRTHLTLRAPWYAWCVTRCCADSRAAPPTPSHAQPYVRISHYVLPGMRGARQGAAGAAALHPHPIPRPTVRTHLTLRAPWYAWCATRCCAGEPRCTPTPSHAQPYVRISHYVLAENEQELREREEFARTCFETLLQFSMLEDIDSLTGGDNDSDPLAIMPLLDRFQEVISRYTSDDDNTEPLPRHQLSEISFVLKAIASLTEAMKKAPPGKVDATAWDKLIGVYPDLVRLAASARAAGASAALREALLQFAALLSAPAPPL